MEYIETFLGPVKVPFQIIDKVSREPHIDLDLVMDTTNMYVHCLVSSRAYIRDLRIPVICSCPALPTVSDLG